MEKTTLTVDTSLQCRDKFYQQIYVAQTLPGHELINLNEFCKTRSMIVIDSCGWYYQQMFPQHTVHRVEGITTCKNMNIGSNYVDILFDDRNDFPNFPSMNFSNAVLILDYSLLLKYRTPEQVFTILNRLADATACSDMCVRISLLHSNDDRFQNRLNQITTIVPTGYSVVKFAVNFDAKYQPLTAHFKKNVIL